MDYLNVKDFWAKGDGKTDDTDAIQKTIRAADPDNVVESRPMPEEPKVVSEEPTTIIFPPGIYLLSCPLEQLSKKGVFLLGEPEDGTETRWV